MKNFLTIIHLPPAKLFVGGSELADNILFL